MVAGSVLLLLSGCIDDLAALGRGPLLIESTRTSYSTVDEELHLFATVVNKSGESRSGILVARLIHNDSGQTAQEEKTEITLPKNSQREYELVLVNPRPSPAPSFGTGAGKPSAALFRHELEIQDSS